MSVANKKGNSFWIKRLISLFYVTTIDLCCFERDHGTGKGANENQEAGLVLAEVVADNAAPGRVDPW